MISPPRLLLLVFLALAATVQAQTARLGWQGRVMAGGVPYTGVGKFKVALISEADGRTWWHNETANPFAAEPAYGVTADVTNGVFNITLGDTTHAGMSPLPTWVLEKPRLKFRAWFKTNDAANYERLEPDQPLASTPSALVATALPSGSITAAKFAAGAVTGAKIVAGSVTGDAVSPGAIVENFNTTGGIGAGIIPVGSLLMSRTPGDPNLLNGGYEAAGKTSQFGNFWFTPPTDGGPPPRSDFAAAWCGDRLVIYGGRIDGLDPPVETVITYSPDSQTWTPELSSGTDTFGRAEHRGVWTGSEFVMWGGVLQGAAMDREGLTFRPANGQWAPVTEDGAPIARIRFTAVWTGQEMIVWGGRRDYGGVASLLTASGARFNPSSGTWHALSSAGAPTARADHSAVWTGSEMVIWGGVTSEVSGTIACTNTGARYNPATDTWSPLSTAAAPTGRHEHVCAWTGTEMLVWGGRDASGPLGTGARYTPSTDTWAPMATAAAPSPRSRCASAWTGQDLFVWGGTGTLSAVSGGSLYSPSTDSWLPVSSLDAPPAHDAPTAVWNGREIILFGGRNFYGQPTADLYLFTPPEDFFLYRKK